MMEHAELMCSSPEFLEAVKAGDTQKCTVLLE